MRVDDLGIALRARSAWEATDLGLALVRAHAARVFGAWFAVTLPAWLAINLLMGLLGWLWLAPLVLWWFKPAFDRSVLFVISRSVFGAAPSLRETLVAQRTWGWRALLPWLTWRRLHPARSLLLPVDLLEGVAGSERRQRAEVLGRGDGATATLLTIVGIHLETVLYLSLIALALMFVPVEFLDDSAKAMFRTLFVEQPPWALVILNLAMWAASSVIEPYYVGAGFGLYLNRRMQLEAWDVELAFRRIAARLAARATAALLALTLAVGALPLAAAPPPPADASTASPAVGPEGERPWAALPAVPPPASARPLEELFGDAWREDGAAFDDAVRKAYARDDLRRTQREWVWRARNQDKQSAGDRPPAWAEGLSSLIAFLVQYGAWIAVAFVLVLLALNWRRWLPALAARVDDLRAPPPPQSLAAAGAEQPLPDDIVGAVRALLAAGRTREALALFYRAAVARLAQARGAPLPPGATEAQCLRHARELGDAQYAQLFGRIVRVWQALAYAQRVPARETVDELLAAWQHPPAVVEAA